MFAYRAIIEQTEDVIDALQNGYYDHKKCTN